MGWREDSSPLIVGKQAASPEAPPAPVGWRSQSSPLNPGQPTPPAAPLPPDPQQGFVNAGNTTSAVGEWARPKEDPSAMGVGQAALDLTRTAGNTFGASDQVGAAIQSGNKLPTLARRFAPMLAPAMIAGGTVDPGALKTQQAESQAARDRLGGALSTAADALGYVPFGLTGVGKGMTEGMGVGMPTFRKIVGQMGEGGIAGGAAAEGHGDSPTAGAAVGALTSLGLSPVTGFANWASRKIGTAGGRLTGMLSNPKDVQPATEAAKDAAYANAATHSFDWRYPTTAYNAAEASLTGPQRQGLSQQMKTTFAGHIGEMTPSPGQTNLVNAEDIDGFQRRLGEAAVTRDDKYLAAKVKDNIDNHILGNAQPSTGQPIGAALSSVQNARQAAQKNIMATGIGESKTDLANRFWSPTPWAEKQLPFYPGEDNPVRQGLSAIIRSSGGQGPVDSHTAQHVAGMAAAGVGGAVGGPAGAVVAENAIPFARPLLKGATKAFQRADVQNQLDKLYGPATGMKTNVDPGVGELIRQATLASEAGHGY